MTEQISNKCKTFLMSQKLTQEFDAEEEEDRSIGRCRENSREFDQWRCKMLQDPAGNILECRNKYKCHKIDHGNRKSCIFRRKHLFGDLTVQWEEACRKCNKVKGRKNNTTQY